MINFFANQKGQLVVEYVLLLILSVGLALILLKLTDLTEGSYLFNFWIHLIRVISGDISTYKTIGENFRT